MKHAISRRWLTSPIEAIAIFFKIFIARMSTLFIIKVKILVFNDNMCVYMMLIVEPKMIIIL